MKHTLHRSVHCSQTRTQPGPSWRTRCAWACVLVSGDARQQSDCGCRVALIIEGLPLRLVLSRAAVVELDSSRRLRCGMREAGTNCRIHCNCTGREEREKDLNPPWISMQVNVNWDQAENAFRKYVCIRMHMVTYSKCILRYYTPQVHVRSIYKLKQSCYALTNTVSHNFQSLLPPFYCHCHSAPRLMHVL